MLRVRAGNLVRLVEPCLPSPAKRPPAGPNWLHEIKHDSFRNHGASRRRGRAAVHPQRDDFTARFPLAAAAVAALPGRSFLIDGEAIVCDKNGLAVFELIRGYRTLAGAVLCAFDLLELDGEDLRRHAIEKRKALLAKLLRVSNLSIVLNEHFEEDGAIVFCWSS
jgi:bifunctional non-homologous end joining protein LigD